MFKDNQIEPGLLSVFRLFNGVQAAILSVAMLAYLGNRQPVPNIYGLILWVQSLGLVLYLSWARLPVILGKIYLPAALFVATVVPVAGLAAATAVRLQQGLSGDLAGLEPGQLYIWLLLPLLLICVQYNWKALLIFTVGTSVLESILAVALQLNGGPTAGPVVGQAAVRTLLFGVAGFIVLSLSQGQRKQRQELARKNAQLAHYATTLEELAISQERNRMARELHDTLAHTLSAVNVQLKALEVLLQTNPEQAHRTLQQTQELTREGLQEARRALHNLRTNPAAELGLGLALQQLATAIAHKGRLQLRLNLPPLAVNIPAATAQTAYRIAEEAMNNVLRHANARHLTLSLSYENATLKLVIADDGHGFDPSLPLPANHYGIVGMKERAGLNNGRLEIFSQPGQGTVVQFVAEV